MTTKLTKPVRRQLLSSTLPRGKHQGRPVIATLMPGDELEFRVKGTRQIYTVYLGHCFRLAQALTIEADYKGKLQDYQLRRKTGRARRPKKPLIPFNRVYFEATKS